MNTSTIFYGHIKPVSEEKFIHYPLDSCIDFVDEIIIVDGCSTDKTVRIYQNLM